MDAAAEESRPAGVGQRRVRVRDRRAASLRLWRRCLARCRDSTQCPGGRALARIGSCWADAAPAIVLWMISVLALWYYLRPESWMPGQREPDVLAFVLVTVQTVSLAWRSRGPIVVLGMVLTATAVLQVLDYPVTGGELAAPAAFFTVALRYGPPRTVLVAVAVAVLIAPQTLLGHVPLSVFLLIHALFGAAWALGDAMRRRAERIAALEQQAASLQVEQQQRVEQAVTNERIQIARELHDLSAHAFGVIAIQSQVAAAAAGGSREEVCAAVNSIDEMAAIALLDLRRLLGFLRSEEESETGRHETRVENLEQLAQGYRDAGLPVHITVEGESHRLPCPFLETSAYRIVQEALTNTLKHAGPAFARVTVRHRPGALEVKVVDSGHGRGPRTQHGAGLAGMGERVALFGGELSHGPCYGGGYAVHAVLPSPKPKAP